MRQRLFAGILFAVVAAMLGLVVPSAQAVPAAPTAVPAPTPWQTGDPVYTAPTRKPGIVGVNYHGVWNDRTATIRAGILDKMQAAGVEWVRLDIAWADFQPQAGTFGGGKTATIDTVLNELSSRGMKVLLLIYWAPSWATGTTAKNGIPKDPTKYGDACAWAAKRWAGKVQAIELWNEPDLDTFLADRSPVTWTKLVKAAYPKIKAAVPGMTVVAGAASAMKMDFYRTAYANGLAGNYDVLGIHSYQGDASYAPDAYDKNYLQYYTANIPNIVSLMRSHGDTAKKIWITEYGWSARTNTSSTPVWERGVTQQRQAEYLVRMQQYVAQWPQVQATFWYNDRNKTTGNAFQDNFGLLRNDLTAKPAFYAMRCAAAGVCGPGSSTPVVAEHPAPAQQPKTRQPSTQQPSAQRPDQGLVQVTRTARRTVRVRASVRVWSRGHHRHARAAAFARRTAKGRATASAVTAERASCLATHQAARRAAARAHAKAHRVARAKAHRRAIRKLARR